MAGDKNDKTLQMYVLYTQCIPLDYGKLKEDGEMDTKNGIMSSLENFIIWVSLQLVGWVGQENGIEGQVLLDRFQTDDFCLFLRQKVDKR
jgi:hypothetical protein